MTHFRSLRFPRTFCFCLVLIVSILAGCGFEQLQLLDPELTAGLTLAELEQIQDDERLTNDEKRQQIRDAIDAPETDSGDRLVNFLLNFNVP